MLLILILYALFNYLCLLLSAVVTYCIPPNGSPKIEFSTPFKQVLDNCHYVSIFMWPLAGWLALILLTGIKLLGVLFGTDHFKYKIVEDTYKGRMFYYVKRLDKFFIGYSEEGLTLTELQKKFSVSPQETHYFLAKIQQIRGVDR